MPRRPTRRRAFGLEILNSNHPDIRRLKRAGHQAELHGHKFWNSSFLIMNHLKRNPLPPNLRILEIGCGWGLLSIFCAQNFGARVTGIDADPNVLPFMQLHAERNQVEVKAEAISFQQLTRSRLAQYDLILGADICYWDEMTRLLFNLIRRARQAGVRQVIISDPCRSPFTELSERCQARWPDAQTLNRRLSRPVRASGELLVVGNL